VEESAIVVEGFTSNLDTVGELSRACCQLVQGGIITEQTLGKLTTRPAENCPNRIRQQYQIYM
jgi:hypothetical protein